MSLIVFKKRNLLLNIFDTLNKRFKKKDATLVSVYDVPSETKNISEFDSNNTLFVSNTLKPNNTLSVSSVGCAAEQGMLSLGVETPKPMSLRGARSTKPNDTLSVSNTSNDKPNNTLQNNKIQNTIQVQKGNSFLKDLLWGHTYENPDTPEKWDPFVCKIEKRLYSKKINRYLLEVSDNSNETFTVHIGSQLFPLIKDNTIQVGDVVRVNYYSATNIQQENGHPRLVLFTDLEKIN